MLNASYAWRSETRSLDQDQDKAKAAEVIEHEITRELTDASTLASYIRLN